MSKKIILIICVLILIAGGITIYYYLNQEDSDNNNNNGTVDKSAEILEDFNDLVETDPDAFAVIKFLNDNMKLVNKTTADEMLNQALSLNSAYIEGDTAKELYDLIYEKYPNNFYLMIDNLNSLTNITDEELKTMVKKYRDAGYQLFQAEGTIWAQLDYQFYLDQYSKYLSTETNKYLEIREDSVVASDAALIITYDELAARIKDTEDFIKSYPESTYIEQVKTLHGGYLTFYLIGIDNTPIYDWDTKVIKDEVIASYNKSINEYEGSRLATILTDYLADLKATNYVLTDSLKAKMQAIILAE